MNDRLVELLRPNVDSDVKLSVVSLFIGKMIEAAEQRIAELESRQLQRGEKGDKGDPGRDGKDGRNGIDGINGLPGKDGQDGKDGKPGAKGKDGISVVDGYIAADGHFVFKLSNGNEIDIGNPFALETFGKHIINTQVAKNQITVSATAPASPQENDLWFDIS